MVYLLSNKLLYIEEEAISLSPLIRLNSKKVKHDHSANILGVSGRY